MIEIKNSLLPYKLTWAAMQKIPDIKTLAIQQMLQISGNNSLLKIFHPENTLETFLLELNVTADFDLNMYFEMNWHLRPRYQLFEERFNLPNKSGKCS